MCIVSCYFPAEASSVALISPVISLDGPSFQLRLVTLCALLRGLQLHYSFHFSDELSSFLLRTLDMLLPMSGVCDTRVLLIL